MTGPATLRLDLPQGLTATRSDALAALVASATGLNDAAAEFPWLAPALLFADDAVQSGLTMPNAGPSDALVQQYQSIRYHRDFPLNAALVATAAQDLRPRSVEYQFALATGDGSPCAGLETALRLVPARDVGAAQPAQIRPQALKDIECGDPVALSQDQVDAYLDLSKDRNPIHSDHAAARALGLDAPVVPGLLLVSLIQPLCTRAAGVGRLHALRARFLAPLCTGQAFRICVQRRGLDAQGQVIRLRSYILDESDRAVAICDGNFG